MTSDSQSTNWSGSGESQSVLEPPAFPNEDPICFEPPPVFRCRIGSRCPVGTFMTKEERDAHIIESEAAVKCPHCNYTFSNRTTLEAHILAVMSSYRVAGKTDESCPICATKLASVDDAIIHTIHHNAVIVYEKQPFNSYEGKWITEPIGPALTYDRRTRLILHLGYKYKSGRASAAKEFTSLKKTFAARNYKCVEPGCSAALLVVKPALDESKVLTSLRSKTPHDHLPETSQNWTGASLLNENDILRTRINNTYDLYECPSVGCERSVLLDRGRNMSRAVGTHYCNLLSWSPPSSPGPSHKRHKRSVHCSRPSSPDLTLRHHPFKDILTSGSAPLEDLTVLKTRFNVPDEVIDVFMAIRHKSVDINSLKMATKEAMAYTDVDMTIRLFRSILRSLVYMKTEIGQWETMWKQTVAVLFGLITLKRTTEIELSTKKLQAVYFMIFRSVRDTCLGMWPSSMRKFLKDVQDLSVQLGYSDNVNEIQRFVDETRSASGIRLPHTTCTKSSSGRTSGLIFLPQTFCVRSLLEIPAGKSSHCKICRSCVYIPAGVTETCFVCQSSTMTGADSQDSCS